MFAPSWIWFIELCNVFNCAYISSSLSNAFISSSSKTFGVTYENIPFVSKSVASIVISILLGISTSSTETPKLSCNPGIAIPITVVFVPSSITFPFDIVMFWLFSFFTIVPATTTNGTYIFTFLPFTVTVLSSLFVYCKVIFTFPDFPAISFAEISFPSNSYFTLHSIGKSFWLSPW